MSAERVEVVPPAVGEKVAVQAFGTSVLVCNVDGELFAVENLCTHARVPLSEGVLMGGEIECPVHGARFDLRTGTAMCRPARRPLRTYTVGLIDGGIELRLD